MTMFLKTVYLLFAGLNLLLLTPAASAGFARLAATSTPRSQQRRTTSSLSSGSSSATGRHSSQQRGTESLEESGIEFVAPDGSVFKRIDHKIKSYPVWGGGGVTVIDKNVREGKGLASRSLSTASNKCNNRSSRAVLSSVMARKGEPIARRSQDLCKQALGDRVNNGTNVQVATSTRYIYDKTNEDQTDASFVDLVEIRGNNNDLSFFKYWCLYDASEQEVKKMWNGLFSTTAAFDLTGGNAKLQEYTYDGQQKPKLFVNQISENQCQFNSSNGTVVVYNMHNELIHLDSAIKTPDVYDCNVGPDDQTNDGYGPMADAYANALKTVEMLTDPDWGNLARGNIAKNKGGVLRLAVHYHQPNYDNAFADGSVLYFGDGGEKAYPLTTCLDIVAHEIGHSITSVKAQLMYRDEPGCLNEAFSDVIAQMAKSYSRGSNNFLIGDECTKSAPFLRNMSVPVQYSDYFQTSDSDSCSDNSLEGCTNQDPHYCSAVPSYIFYKMATANGWSTKSAGRAWIFANLLYWNPETTIKEAGCSIYKVVDKFDIGDVATVVEAWNAVGIDISDCTLADDCIRPVAPTDPPTPLYQPPTSPSTKTPPSTKKRPKPATTAKTVNALTMDVENLENCQARTGITATVPGQEYKFVVDVPSNATYENVQIYCDNGDADLYIAQNKMVSTDSYDDAPLWAGSNEWVVGPLKKPKPNRVYILIKAAAPYRNLGLHACFY